MELPLIQWHGCRNNRQPQSTKDSSHNHHRVHRRTGLNGRADTSRKHADQGGISSAQEIACRVRKEDVTEPCAQIVDCGDETSVGSTRVIESFDEARMHIDAGKNANVITTYVLINDIACGGLTQKSALRKLTYPQTKEPNAKKAQMKCKRTTDFGITAILKMMIERNERPVADGGRNCSLFRPRSSQSLPTSPAFWTCYMQQCSSIHCVWGVDTHQHLSPLRRSSRSRS
jgi:hypothetical protein